MAPVGVTHVGSKGRDFHSVLAVDDDYNTKLRAHGKAVREESQNLIGRGVGCHVEIGRLAAKDQVAHTPADKQRLKAPFAEAPGYLESKFSAAHA